MRKKVILQIVHINPSPFLSLKVLVGIKILIPLALKLREYT